MTPELLAELELALDANEGRLGAVYRLIKSGVDSDRAIVDAGGAANTGAASNLQATIRTILDKKLPNGPSLALQIGRSVGGLLRDNPNLSEDARTYLENLRTRLEVLASDADAIESETRVLEKGSQALEKSLENLPGVYVYTLPAFRRVVKKTDPDRWWFKVGETSKTAGKRVADIAQITGLPENPWIARVYRHAELVPKALEKKFHDLLAAAGHNQAQGRHAGEDWYATNLEFLDAIANALGCETSKNDEPGDE
jgi:hypothetical protein